MDLMHPRLSAFSAVIEEGSFEAAARRLSVTPSAISQRIRHLEDGLGQLLVVRQPPCRPTPAGEQLLRRVRAMQLLQAEALDELAPARRTQSSWRSLVIAVNDDSLETWLIAALARLHHEHGYVFDVRVDDQDHTLALLREGAVIGAVTSEATPVQGCRVSPLGVMRYRAIAAPDFARRHFGTGLCAETLAQAPMIVFNRKDALQWRFIRSITRARLNPPLHYLPTATGFIEAAALGLGWCLAPDSLIHAALHERRIVDIAPGRWLDVPLYWQHAAIPSRTLEEVSQVLQQVATAMLKK
ncbi:LysR family transcriptional regulator ArgP [Herbaspirillum sp. NPDC087042]|uniref:LysR family transcriptional regulator ArgP n=1 Tax=Herbaspirillum sp. NPDC087042 TaxID=3364004 RepID=UPI00381E4111